MSNKKFSYRRIARVCGRYAVQGHSKSMILVPVKSPYATFYQRIILTYILHWFPVIGQYLSNYRLWQGVPLVNAFVLGNLCKYRYKSYTAKTRLFGLHFCRRQTVCLAATSLTYSFLILNMHCLTFWSAPTEICNLPESSTTVDTTWGFWLFSTSVFYQLVSTTWILSWSNLAPYRPYQKTTPTT